MTKLKQYKREVDEGQYFLCNDIIFKSTFDKKEYLKKLLEEALDIRVIEVIDSSNTEMTVTSKRDLAGGAHLRSENGVYLLEHIEGEHRLLDAVMGKLLFL